MCGDVEKNPGPYIAGIIQASFSQGQKTIFWWFIIFYKRCKCSYNILYGRVSILPCGYTCSIHWGKPDSNESGIIVKFEYILKLISYITDIYENISTVTQYEWDK